jgi:hypothetical protein
MLFGINIRYLSTIVLAGLFVFFFLFVVFEYFYPLYLNFLEKDGFLQSSYCICSLILIIIYSIVVVYTSIICIRYTEKSIKLTKSLIRFWEEEDPEGPELIELEFELKDSKASLIEEFIWLTTASLTLVVTIPLLVFSIKSFF